MTHAPRRMSLLAASLLAACGQPTRPPATPPAPTPEPAPRAPTPPVDPPVARHAAPTCPFTPYTMPADPDAPHDGVEGMARRAKPEHGDRCETADSNLARVEKAILATPAPAPVKRADKPWDGRAKPKFTPDIDRRLALTADEHAHLARDHFVVLDRFTGSYGNLFHEVYQSELPIYVSIDAVLHAVYLGNDNLMGDLEDAHLAPRLAQLLDNLACALPAAASAYPADTARDLDLYVAVARALLRGTAPQSMFGDPAVEAEAQRLIAAATAAAEMTKVSLFGRDRVIDFTAYTPRGHYAATDARKQFFRAEMWLSRLELNLVSRSSRSSQPGASPDPRETPREDVLALALADLVERAGATADVAALDRAWGVLAGYREDVSIAELAKLRAQAQITSLTAPDAADRLRAAIGDRYQRTARLHYMPEGSPILPAIATLLGPRVVPDAQATRPLVHDEVANREILHAADLGYALGHDRALVYLAEDRKAFPTLDAQLAKARAIVTTAHRGDDLYSAWLDAVVGLAKPETGTLPSYAALPAYADRRLESALVGYGQIKHNYVLAVGESYFAGGCEIPDGYVEPASATYDHLLDYAHRGAALWPTLDPKDTTGGRAYFERLGTLLGTLRAIQLQELAGRPLTEDQRAFLSMVVEMAPGTTGGPPTYTGWWFDLFRRRELDGLAPPDFIASFFTGGKIAYLGATQPRLGVFVVDTGGAPRLAVGPVARGYEYQGPVAKRVADADARELPEAERSSPWAATYAVKPVGVEPKLHVSWTPGSGIELAAPAALGTITIDVLDHHRRPIKTIRRDVKAGKTVIDPKLTRKQTERAEGLHFRIGTFDAWEEVGVVESAVYASFGGYTGSDE